MTRYRPTAHRPYIEHVHHALSRAEVAASFPVASSSECRSAFIGLMVDASGPYGAYHGVDLAWSEMDGWRLATGLPAEPHGSVAHFLDVPILAAPDEVTDAARQVLAGETPALRVPREVRLWAEDPLFEAELDRYTVTLGRRAEPAEEEA